MLNLDTVAEILFIARVIQLFIYSDTICSERIKNSTVQNVFVLNIKNMVMTIVMINSMILRKPTNQKWRLQRLTVQD